jgi:hypothetical protein
MLRELGIPYGTNQVFCRTCLAIAANHNGDQYPQYCMACMKVFDGPQQYTLPDFTLGSAILYVNGTIHDKNKNVRKDKDQIAAVKEAGYFPFVIKNEEIDNMTNASLKLYLLGIWASLKAPMMYEKVYRNEREYACLRS